MPLRMPMYDLFEAVLVLWQLQALRVLEAESLMLSKGRAVLQTSLSLVDS